MVGSPLCPRRYAALYLCSISANVHETGPYASAPLRFQVSFPVSTSDQNLPPLVTFSTDIFHPLVVPLTTYTFSTAQTYSPVRRGEQETVSATDDERLPPGGFSLRHGFPDWFGRKEKRNFSGSSAEGASDSGDDFPRNSIPVPQLLSYIKSCFDDEKVLDDIPLEAAGNPGAWHAWRTHRKSEGRKRWSAPMPPGSPSKTPGPKQPGEWNWDGVFEKRVRSGIDASLSDQVLFGGKGGGSDNDVVWRLVQIFSSS